MDDPWGSPWAEESLYPSRKADKLVSKKSVVPEKDFGANQDSRSPWNDDDAYGEWATVPTTDDVQLNIQDEPEQAESVESGASNSEEVTQGEEHIRPDGSTWFTREIGTANAASLGEDRSQINGRALSPDPWSGEAAISDEKLRSDLAEDMNSGLQPSKSDTDGTITRAEIAVVNDADEFNTIDQGGPGEPVPSNSIENVPLIKSATEQDQDRSTTALNHDKLGAEIEEMTHGECSASRPSSSPSDHSHHDEVLVESPRTSFEEAEERPKVEREGSSKVKEMVRLFDGLAVEQNVDDLSCQGSVDPPEDQQDTPLAAQSEDDFGEFEEGASPVAGKFVQTTEDSSANAEVEQSPKARARDDPASKSSTEQAIIGLLDQSAKLSEPVHFEPDLSLLGQVFGPTVKTDSLHADPSLAPDIETVIADSLSSIQERKTWYRISRYGTMRKHNAGDEDSYVRINWKDSEIRVETLKTVERWIEEDRLGGGVILGGGTKLGSMFGWGQKNAAPMSVAAALASRNRKPALSPDHVESPISVRSPDASPLSVDISSRRSLEQTSVPRRSLQSPLSATAPQFTWSTGTPRSSIGEAKLPSLPTPPLLNDGGKNSGTSAPPPKAVSDSSSRVSMLTTAGPSVHKSTRPLSPSIMIGNSTKLAHQPGNTNILQTSVKDVPEVEDDWGEMVSSPSLEDGPPLVLPIKSQTEASAREMPSSELITDSSTNGLGNVSDRHSTISNSTAQLASENTISPLAESPAIKSKSISFMAPKSDPWQTADFSFFDDPIESVPKVAPLLADPKALDRLPVTVRQGRNLSNEQTEQDKIVKGIVQNLPNLSYMLRR